MDKFTRAGVVSVRDEMVLAMGEVAAKHGLKIEVGEPRWSQELITFQVNAVPAGAENLEERDFKALAQAYGLKPDDYKRQFLHDGRAYTLLGFNTQAVKYPIKAALVSTGTVYRLPSSAFRTLLDPQEYDKRWGYSRLRPVGRF